MPSAVLGGLCINSHQALTLVGFGVFILSMTNVYEDKIKGLVSAILASSFACNQVSRAD